MNKKGENILTENVIFIVLNLVFLSILIIFIFSKMQGAANLEEMYAKQIALMIDGARPETEIRFNMEEAFEVSEDEGYEGDLITINDGIVRVKLREDGGYTYSYFNDVNVDVFENEEKGQYVFLINSREDNE
jgi:hypothetical protein